MKRQHAKLERQRQGAMEESDDGTPMDRRRSKRRRSMVDQGNTISVDDEEDGNQLDFIESRATSPPTDSCQQIVGNGSTEILISNPDVVAEDLLPPAHLLPLKATDEGSSHGGHDEDHNINEGGDAQRLIDNPGAGMAEFDTAVKGDRDSPEGSSAAAPHVESETDGLQPRISKKRKQPSATFAPASEDKSRPQEFDTAASTTVDRRAAETPSVSIKGSRDGELSRVVNQGQRSPIASPTRNRGRRARGRSRLRPRESKPETHRGPAIIPSSEPRKASEALIANGERPGHRDRPLRRTDDSPTSAARCRDPRSKAREDLGVKVSELFSDLLGTFPPLPSASPPTIERLPLPRQRLCSRESYENMSLDARLIDVISVTRKKDASDNMRQCYPRIFAGDGVIWELHTRIEFIIIAAIQLILKTPEHSVLILTKDTDDNDLTRRLLAKYLQHFRGIDLRCFASAEDLIKGLHSSSKCHILVAIFDDFHHSLLSDPALNLRVSTLAVIDTEVVFQDGGKFDRIHAALDRSGLQIIFLSERFDRKVVRLCKRYVPNGFSYIQGRGETFGVRPVKDQKRSEDLDRTDLPSQSGICEDNRRNRSLQVTNSYNSSERSTGHYPSSMSSSVLISDKKTDDQASQDQYSRISEQLSASHHIPRRSRFSAAPSPCNRCGWLKCSRPPNCKYFNAPTPHPDCNFSDAPWDTSVPSLQPNVTRSGVPWACDWTRPEPENKSSSPSTVRPPRKSRFHSGADAVAPAHKEFPTHHGAQHWEDPPSYFPAFPHFDQPIAPDQGMEAQAYGGGCSHHHEQYQYDFAPSGHMDISESPYAASQDSFFDVPPYDHQPMQDNWHQAPYSDWVAQDPSQYSHPWSNNDWGKNSHHPFIDSTSYGFQRFPNEVAAYRGPSSNQPPPQAMLSHRSQNFDSSSPNTKRSRFRR